MKTTSVVFAFALTVVICSSASAQSSLDGLDPLYDREGNPKSIPSAANTENLAKIVGIGGKCLDVYGGGSANGTHLVLWPCHGGVNQRWQIVGGLIKGIGGKCLDVYGGGSANGTHLVLWPCHGGANQRWQIVDGLIKGIGGKCLDVSGGGSADGTHIVLWPCHGGTNQRWVIQ